MAINPFMSRPSMQSIDGIAPILNPNIHRVPMALAGQGGTTPGGPIADPNIICYEDGTCGPGYPQVGQSQNPNGWSLPPNIHKIYGDGTGGHFITTSNHVAPNQYVASIEGTGGPQPVGPPAASPSPGMDFAQLLNILRMERDAYYVRRRLDPRNRGDL